jgi:hypothetical protein
MRFAIRVFSPTTASDAASVLAIPAVLAAAQSSRLTARAAATARSTGNPSRPSSVPALASYAAHSPARSSTALAKCYRSASTTLPSTPSLPASLLLLPATRPSPPTAGHRPPTSRLLPQLPIRFHPSKVRFHGSLMHIQSCTTPVHGLHRFLHPAPVNLSSFSLCPACSPPQRGLQS